MTRRRLPLFASLAVAVLLLGALESQRVVTGWVRDEAFYRGRPTTFWRGELRRWDIIDLSLDGVDDPVAYLRQPGFWDKVPLVGRRIAAPGLTPFDGGGGDARAVLAELSRDDDDHVRTVAAGWLRRLD